MADLDILFEALVEPEGMDKGAAVIPGKNGKPHATIFTAKDSVRWQDRFAAIANAHAPREIIECPVRVDILAVLPRPQKFLRKKDRDGFIAAPQKPDGDNIRKNVQDAMRSWWRDDKQVVAGQTVKVYAERTGLPRTIVRVRSIDDDGVAAIIEPVFGSVERANSSPATSDDRSGGAANDWVEQAIREAAGAP